MKKSIIILILISLSFSLNACTKNTNTNNNRKDLTHLRIGWQIPWATQGQLIQVLKRTDLLKEQRLEAEFKGFSYGGPLNEAALTGGVDVLFTADQPATMLLSKDDGWIIIGRLMYNRVSLYVPPKSPIQSVADLKNKTVGMPFGAAAQRMALMAEEEAGLDSKSEVNNINLGIYEQSDLLRDPEAEKWGNIDALAGFDPTPAIFEEKGLVRNLKVGKIVSVIIMSKQYIKNNPEAPTKFLNAFRSAYDFYRTNVEQANRWFTEEASLDITPQALAIAASIEPNLEATDISGIRLDFTDDDYAIMQEASDFLFEQEYIEKKVIIKDYINLSYLQ